MKPWKSITFFVIFPIIFLLLYRNSKNTGFKRWWLSFKIAIVITTSLASLTSDGAKASQFSTHDREIIHQRVISDQTLKSMEENGQSVILVKSGDAPISSPTPSRGIGPGNSSFQSSGSRSNRPVRGTPINPYRVPPKTVKPRWGLPYNPGLGGKPNPGGGDDDPDFDDICPVPKKDEAKNEKPVDRDFFPDSKTKKQQSNENSQLPENVGKIEIINRINDHSGIAREARKTLKNQQVAKEIKHLIKQLSLGNFNPGKGTTSVKGLKKIFEARSENGGRVYFRNQDNGQQVEILAISGKKNQKKVIDFLKEINN